MFCVFPGVPGFGVRVCYVAVILVRLQLACKSVKTLFTKLHTFFAMEEKCSLNQQCAFYSKTPFHFRFQILPKFQTQFPFHSKVLPNSFPFPKYRRSGLEFHFQTPNRHKFRCIWHAEVNFGVSKLGTDFISATKSLDYVITS